MAWEEIKLRKLFIRHYQPICAIIRKGIIRICIMLWCKDVTTFFSPILQNARTLRQRWRQSEWINRRVVSLVALLVQEALRNPRPVQVEHNRQFPQEIPKPPQRQSPHQSRQ